MPRYVCKKPLYFHEVDDDGRMMEKFALVDVGDVYDEQYTSYRMDGGPETIRLVEVNSSMNLWIEITGETLNEHFGPLV